MRPQLTNERLVANCYIHVICVRLKSQKCRSSEQVQGDGGTAFLHAPQTSCREEYIVCSVDASAVILFAHPCASPGIRGLVRF
eukprot:scaffold195867_cov39-Tisochrysis_lutea.AAC.2